MTDRIQRLLLGGVTIAVLTGAGALWEAARIPLQGGVPIPAQVSGGTALPGGEQRSPARDAGVATKDLFRTDRRAPPSPFDPYQPDSTAPTRLAADTLVLIGVLLGHPSVAVVRGRTSGAARVLVEGEEIQGTRLIRVTVGRITLTSGRDTIELALPEVAQ